MNFKKNSKYMRGKYVLLAALFVLSYININSQVQRNRTATLMGCKFDFSILAEDSLQAEKYIDKAIDEIVRIENLISDWKPDSQVSKVNQNAGIQPVKVDREVLELTRRAIKISEITEGAFDISFAAMDKIWKFDGSMKKVPSEEQIKESIKKISYKNIIIDTLNSTLFLKLPGMKIGFGSIGKGYAADKAKELMVKNNVKAGIINASGDISVWGHKINGEYWNIGIINPFEPSDITGFFTLKDECVTTSGSYEKYVELEGKKYSHIIDPRTGYPVKGIKSVSVIGPNAETANGFSTSIMVLGVKAGRKLINHYPDYSCLIITDAGKIRKSKYFKTKVEFYNKKIKSAPRL
ncbi:FAD:protein FMN transferase [Apibacter sp. ESL0432]|nr:FAD:protein FMN transferase [Apibacter sp. ESL0432]